MIATEDDPTPLVLILANTVRRSVDADPSRVAKLKGVAAVKSATDPQAVTLHFDKGDVYLEHGVAADAEVNSLHHQVVAVEPPGSRVVARNTDGHIEGIEFPDADRILGVQWHPEMLRHRREQLALFDDLVANALAVRV